MERCPSIRAVRVSLPGTQFQGECVRFFGDIVQLFGIPKSVGQIYGLLFSSPEALGFADIVARLEISKGSASQGLQLLRELGAIQVADSKAGSCKGWDQGGRVRYQPELSLRRLVGGILEGRLVPLAASGAARLVRVRELAERESNDEFYLERVQQLETWRRRFKSVLPVLIALLGANRAKR